MFIFFAAASFTICPASCAVKLNDAPVLAGHSTDEITQKFHVVDVRTHKKGERNIGQAINSVNTDAVLPNFRDILEHVADDVNIYESNTQKINYSITPSEAEYQITSDDVLDTMETNGDFEDGSYVPIDDPLVMEGRARSEDTIRELKNQLEELQKKSAKQSLEIEKLKTARKFDKKLTHGKVLKEKSVKPQS